MHPSTPQPGRPGPYPGWHAPSTPPRRSNTALVVVVAAVGGLLVLGVGGAAAFLLLSGGGDAADHGGPEGVAHIDGVQYFSDVPAGHTEDPVVYPQTPPAGGEHHPQWLDCGVYTEPVPAEHAVHAQEHGAVWITYRPDLPAEEVEQLAAHYEDGSYLVISPHPELTDPVVLSAWGSRLTVDSATDPRIAEYLDVHEQGETVPEPGAPCSGGVTP